MEILAALKGKDDAAFIQMMQALGIPGFAGYGRERTDSTRPTAVERDATRLPRQTRANSRHEWAGGRGNDRDGRWIGR